MVSARRKQRERKLSPVQLREFGARALVPRSLTREKKLPDWQLNEDLLRCALHPGFPITVDATCDDVPRKLTVATPSLDPRLHDRWVFNPRYPGDWSAIVATNPELFKTHFKGHTQLPVLGTTPTMSTMAVVVEYMANQGYLTSLDPSLWPLSPNVDYYWAGARAREPRLNSEIKLSFNKCPQWRVWGKNLEYAYTTTSCLRWALGGDVADVASLKVGYGMQLTFVRYEGCSYRNHCRYGPVDPPTPTTSPINPTFTTTAAPTTSGSSGGGGSGGGSSSGGGGSRGGGSSGGSSSSGSKASSSSSSGGISKLLQPPRPRWNQEHWDSEKYQCSFCSDGDLCRAVGGPVNEDHRLLYQASLDEAAMKRGSDIPEVIPPMLGLDYMFQPTPQHLQEAAAAAEAADLPGLMDWGAVAVVMSGERWTLKANGSLVTPGKPLIHRKGTWWEALARAPVKRAATGMTAIPGNHGVYKVPRRQALGAANPSFDGTDPWWMWEE